MLVNGVLWTLTYVLMIERGREDETYGMPLAALCANLSWEFIFVFVFPHGAVQRTVNAVWLALDLMILSQVLRFGHKEFPAMPAWVFRAAVLCGLVLGFGAVFSVTVEFSDYQGAYAAFGQVVLMGVLFPWMLYARRSLRGQSFAIALCKMFGSASAACAFWLYAPITQGSLLLPFFFVSGFALDALYACLVLLAGRGKLFADDPSGVGV
jgi:hypothetical protein